MPTDGNEPTAYEIHVEGHLDDRWAAWFDGMRLTNQSDGTTVIGGPVVDQAALHGVLRRLADLGLPLLAVRRLPVPPPASPDPSPRSTTVGSDPEGNHDDHRN